VARHHIGNTTMERSCRRRRWAGQQDTATTWQSWTGSADWLDVCAVYCYSRQAGRQLHARMWFFAGRDGRDDGDGDTHLPLPSCRLIWPDPAAAARARCRRNEVGRVLKTNISGLKTSSVDTCELGSPWPNIIVNCQRIND
jgi:hypothetical protein